MNETTWVVVVNGEVMGSGSFEHCQQSAEFWSRHVQPGGRADVMSWANAVSKGLVKE